MTPWNRLDYFTKAVARRDPGCLQSHIEALCSNSAWELMEEVLTAHQQFLRSDVSSRQILASDAAQILKHNEKVSTANAIEDVLAIVGEMREAVKKKIRDR